MRIAIYSHSIAPSIDGVCRRFTGILKELEGSGEHQTLLFTLEGAPEDVPGTTRTVSLDHMFFPAYPEKKVAKPSLRSFALIVAALREFRPQVLHVVADAYSQSFALAGLLLGVPVVGSFHTDLIDLLRTHGAFLFQEWFVLAKEITDALVLDAAATTSKSFQQKLATHRVCCDHVIATAVNNEVFCPAKRSDALRKEMTFGDPDAFLCVYVGRISEEKRIDVLLEALKLLRGRKTAYLAIVGDGPLGKKFAQLHGEENHVYCRPRFLSHHELAEVYASADVHVSASEFETLGNTVYEAFACGIPVVVPRTQGFVNTVEDKVTGYLFASKDPHSAVQYLQSLKDNEEHCREMGLRALKEVKQLTYARVVQNLLQWYERGAVSRNNQSMAFKSLKFTILFSTVTLACVMHTVYDFIVNNLLASSANKKKV